MKKSNPNFNSNEKLNEKLSYSKNDFHKIKY